MSSRPPAPDNASCIMPDINIAGHQGIPRTLTRICRLATLSASQTWSSLRTSSADKPATQITFCRLLSPEAMVTEEGGTFKSFAKNLTQAVLALPPIGGAVSDTFSAAPISPVTAFFFARGCTLTANVAAPREFCIGITSSSPKKMRFRSVIESRQTAAVDCSRFAICRCSTSERARRQASLCLPQYNRL